MADDRLEGALARLETALARAEAAADSLAGRDDSGSETAAALAALEERHGRLKASVAQGLRQLDEILAGMSPADEPRPEPTA